MKVMMNSTHYPSKVVVLLIALLASPSAQAFAPTTGAGQKVVGSASSLVQKRPIVAAASTTALSMNLFDRISRVTRANINNALIALEDPEKVMNQAMSDMQTDLTKIRTSYANVVASQRRLEKQKQQAESTAQDWYNRAQLALRRNKEDLAREALARRELELEKANELQRQCDVQGAALDKLYDGMQTLEAKMLESKAKKDEMISRARAAKTTKKVNDMLSGLQDRVQLLGGVLSVSSTEAFKRMEEKVEAMEVAAEASAELGNMNVKVLPGSSKKYEGSLESQFKLLEKSDSVEKELQKMKGLLTGSTTVSSGAGSFKKDLAKSLIS